MTDATYMKKNQSKKLTSNTKIIYTTKVGHISSGKMTFDTEECCVTDM